MNADIFAIIYHCCQQPIFSEEKQHCENTSQVPREFVWGERRLSESWNWGAFAVCSTKKCLYRFSNSKIRFQNVSNVWAYSIDLWYMCNTVSQYTYITNVPKVFAFTSNATMFLLSNSTKEMPVIQFSLFIDSYERKAANVDVCV